MKNLLLLFFFTFHFIVIGQINNKYELPPLKDGDSVVLLIKRNNYFEKIIMNKSKLFTKICFFKKTVVMSLNKDVKISNKEKENKLKQIKEFNKKLFTENEQYYLGENKLLKDKYFIFTERFVLTEERVVYSTLKKVVFVNLSTLVITDRHTDITISFNNKVLKKIRINWFIFIDNIIFI